ncbi:aminotransferase class I/II-fold pyridoxal phosphate-dependent enzyme [Actinospongicola halichondriae]|uniref:aminotransferase class I/II-fold pyridoxal phosphate-dependent enzyme n=1 Tax=Actinospongicola halichondriae TaxID=3236844 RepID=UPI003D3E99F7
MSPLPASWADLVDDDLRSIDQVGRRRSLRTFDACGPTGVLDGQTVTSYASNDYLGLSAHPAVCAAAADAAQRWGAGSTASRLVVGTRPAHVGFETAYASWKDAEASLVFSSGYAANLAVLSTLGRAGTTIVSDELNHASIIDGCRLAAATTVVSRHNDVAHVEELVSGAAGPVIVVTDTVFSMDGDVAPVADLVDVCRRHGALLVVDEAHAVLGPDVPVGGDVVRVGTLSKALGSQGGVVAGPAPIVDLLVNRARSFIFSTGLSPADVAAAGAAMAIVQSPAGNELTCRLREVIDRVLPGHPSPIVPIVIGDEHDAMAAAAALLERGILVPAIRPPTVAPGTSRLRVALSAAHTDEMIDALLAAFDEIGVRA